MAGWSTGGFAPQSLNLLYYHSLLVELITLVIFVIGSFNFALHYAVWTGNRREIYRNIEVRSFTITALLGTLMLSIGFGKFGVYGSIGEFFRKGFYNLASGPYHHREQHHLCDLLQPVNSASLPCGR